MKINGPGRPKSPKPVLAVRISQEVMDHLNELEKRTGVPRAEIVERCLSVGIADQEEFVGWLESSVKGPALDLFFHPKVIGTIMSLAGLKPDEIQRKVIDNVSERRRAKRQAGKPATA